MFTDSKPIPLDHGQVEDQSASRASLPIELQTGQKDPAQNLDSSKGPTQTPKSSKGPARTRKRSKSPAKTRKGSKGPLQIGETSNGPAPSGVTPVGVEIHSGSAAMPTGGLHINLTDTPSTWSYDSMFGVSVRRARDPSRESTEPLFTFFWRWPCLFLRALALAIGKAGVMIIVGLGLAVPVASIVLGALYLDQCPVQRYIPIYLIVGGAFGTASFLGLCHFTYYFKENECKCNRGSCLTTIFLLGWFIAGNVWIYGVLSKWSRDPNSEFYCHPTLYLYAFWHTNTTYILWAVFFCCLVPCAACCKQPHTPTFYK